MYDRLHQKNPDKIYQNDGYILLTFFLFAISLIFYSFTKAENVSDYDSYVFLIDRIYYFYDPSQIYYEPASTFLLYMSRIISGDTISAVSVARYFTTFILIFSVFILGKYRNVSTTSLVLIIAAFGPLLAFVTIRATPAYVLIALAALDANEGRRRAIVWAILALQFHVSAILAMPAIMISLIQNRTHLLSFIERSLNGVIAFLALIGLIIFFFGQSFSDLLLQSVGQIGFLLKYIAYVGVLDKSNVIVAVNNGSSQTYHQIYLFISAALLGFILYSKNINCIKFRSYAIVSFGIFLFMQFSPVTAFRFSLFWIIPAFLLIPWNQYIRIPLARAVAIFTCLAIFVFQLNGIVT